MLSKDIIAVWCENLTEHTTTFCGIITEIFLTLIQVLCTAADVLWEANSLQHTYTAEECPKGFDILVVTLGLHCVENEQWYDIQLVCCERLMASNTHIQHKSVTGVLIFLLSLRIYTALRTDTDYDIQLVCCELASNTHIQYKSVTSVLIFLLSLWIYIALRTDTDYDIQRDPVGKGVTWFRKGHQQQLSLSSFKRRFSNMAYRASTSGDELVSGGRGACVRLTLCLAETSQDLQRTFLAAEVNSASYKYLSVCMSAYWIPALYSVVVSVCTACVTIQNTLIIINPWL
jgi:hypothetical protein